MMMMMMTGLPKETEQDVVIRSIEFIGAGIAQREYSQ
jgi:hypothetical protein